MIIFAWKVNNPLSFLISRRASESFKSLFSAPFQFVLEFTKTYTDFMLFSYSLNSNHDVSLLGALVLYAVPLPSPLLTQRRHHAVPRHVFTRLPQQALSHQSQNNLLQEDADGRGKKEKKWVQTDETNQPKLTKVDLILFFPLPGVDQQRLHSRQRGLRVLHKGGQHDHSHRRLPRHLCRHRRPGRYRHTCARGNSKWGRATKSLPLLSYSQH